MKHETCELALYFPLLLFICLQSPLPQHLQTLEAFQIFLEGSSYL